jgi:hypothetical protein
MLKVRDLLGLYFFLKRREKNRGSDFCQEGRRRLGDHRTKSCISYLGSGQHSSYKKDKRRAHPAIVAEETES